MATSKSIHNDALFLKRLADEWQKLLKGSRFIRSASISATEIYLLFTNACWKCQLFQGSLLIQIVPKENFPKRKTIQQFKILQHQEIQEVKWTEFDRQIHIDFDKSNSLVFQFFGRRANICHILNNSVASVFGYAVSEVSFQDTKIDLSVSEESEFLANHRFITPEFHEFLKKNDFYVKPDKEDIWANSLDAYWSQDFLLQKTLKPQLQWAQKGHINGSEMVFSSPMDALSKYSRSFLSFETKRLSRQAALIEVQKQERKTSKSLKRAKSALKKLQSETSPKEKADVLMANLHAVSKGMDKVELFNFYTQESVIIKLDPLLNAQDNAEKLYRKAKRRHIQISKAEETVSHYETILKNLVEQEKNIQEETWEPTQAKAVKSVKKVDKPWKEEEFEGIGIRIGKNANSNDALIKASKKHWIWMHARETAGSHVILETDNPSNILLEYAASLAAFNSKAKSSGLVPVIYTPLKFVRKFKNASPGQVRVDKEKVILIEPEHWKNWGRNPT